MTHDAPPDDVSLLRRRRMVEEQIASRGIRDQKVLEAMLAVPRERFVPAGLRHEAFDDRALPIPNGQTISQPFIVAYMTAQLASAEDSRTLEIGTGTGYQTAILARLSGHVYSIERIAALKSGAEMILAELGVTNVSLIVGDGSLGLPEQAPFDRIMITAAAPSVPRPLLAQLADGGKLVAPVGGDSEQTIVRVERHGQRTRETPLLACRFVKLIGTAGWSEGEL